MRRLDPTQLPAVWAYRTRKVVFGVERTILCTFNQELFEAQTRTLAREIRKRKRKLQTLTTRLKRRHPGSRGKAPTVEGVQKQVKEILRGRHMADLFTVQVRQSRHRLPRLAVRFREPAYRHLAATLLGKTLIFTDRSDWSDEQIVLAYRAQHHVEADFRRLKRSSVSDLSTDLPLDRPETPGPRLLLRPRPHAAQPAAAPARPGGPPPQRRQDDGPAHGHSRGHAPLSRSARLQDNRSRVPSCRTWIRPSANSSTSSASSGTATRRSYTPQARAPAPGAAQRLLCPARVVKSG